MERELSIDELAAESGLSRRAVRFYVQQKLLPAPLSRGRHARYTSGHLEQLRRIVELQTTGHSLDEIRQIFSGIVVPPPEAPRRGRKASFRADLLTRITLIDGVEISFDATRFRPSVEDLEALRKLIRCRFNNEGDADGID